jgi:hypothetical protein
VGVGSSCNCIAVSVKRTVAVILLEAVTPTSTVYRQILLFAAEVCGRSGDAREHRLSGEVRAQVRYRELAHGGAGFARGAADMRQ